MQDKIDIIIPVYNSHEFLHIPLDSLARQTIRDQLIIYIIDNKSDYGYSEILQKYKDVLNIKEIKLKKNLYAGGGRQKGIEKSSSKYIAFMDSDDEYASNDILEKMYNAFAQNSQIKRVMGYRNANNEKSNQLVHICNKMFRKDIIDKYHIKFPRLLIAEDLAFNYKYDLVLNEDESIILNDIVYNYNIINKNSIMHKNNNILIQTANIYEACIDYVKFAKKNKLIDKANSNIIGFWNSFYHLYTNIKFINEEEMTSYYKLCGKFYKKYHKYISKDISKLITNYKYKDWFNKVEQYI